MAGRGRAPTVRTTVAAFQIFEPNNVPSDELALPEYGNSELDALLLHYGTEAWADMCDEEDFVVLGCSRPLVNADRCRQDWNSFRRVLFTGRRDGKFKDLVSFLTWYENGDLPQYYDGLTTLLRIAVVLPVSTSSVERSFSAMKIIKSRMRNRLGEDALEALMISSVEGPSELSEAQLTGVIDAFKAMKPRRIAL